MIPGYQCLECDDIFIEPEYVEGSERSEAWGAVETRAVVSLECPTCGSTELDQVEICRKCRDMEANAGDGLCGICAVGVSEIELIKYRESGPC